MKMLISAGRRLAALALVLGVTAHGAAAEEIAIRGTFAWFSVGKTYTLAENHFFFLGQFGGTFVEESGEGLFHLAAVNCPGAYDLGRNASGYCIVTDRDGDQINHSFTCTAIEERPPGALNACEGTAEWKGISGKYLNVSGGGTFKGYTTVIHADGTASGYAVWDYAVTM